MNPMLVKLRHRFLQAVAPGRLTWEENFRPRWVVGGHGKFEAGRRTYWFGDCRFTAWKSIDEISVGSFCSLASGVLLQAGGNHDVSAVSTYPFSMIDRWQEWNAEVQPAQHLRIGNDVWVGAHAMVLGDVEIGDGAVIGAGAVVVRDVPPYSVAVGAPARVVRQRFSDEDIAALLELRWWEWPDERVLEAEPCLRADDVGSLLAFAEEHSLLEPDLPAQPSMGAALAAGGAADDR